MLPDKLRVIWQPAHVKRLLDGLEHITANPAEWKQDVWQCATGMCLYGRITEQAKLHLSWGSCLVYSEDGDCVGDIQTVVNELIGLASHQLDGPRAWALEGITEDFMGHDLSDGDNTLASLWEMAEALTGGTITPPIGMTDGTHPYYMARYETPAR